MPKPISSQRVETTVRDFIAHSRQPVKFSDLMTHVAEKFPKGSYKAVQVKLATYRVIESGEARVTQDWAISREEEAVNEEAISNRRE